MGEVVEFVEHMQVMEIGQNTGTKFRVLLCAETDAIDEDGNPVEGTASNPYHWGTKLMENK
jgi:hypothetical protein